MQWKCLFGSQPSESAQVKKFAKLLSHLFKHFQHQMFSHRHSKSSVEQKETLRPLNRREKQEVLDVILSLLSYGCSGQINVWMCKLFNPTRVETKYQK